MLERRDSRQPEQCCENCGLERIKQDNSKEHFLDCDDGGTDIGDVQNSEGGVLNGIDHAEVSDAAGSEQRIAKESDQLNEMYGHTQCLTVANAPNS